MKTFTPLIVVALVLTACGPAGPDGESRGADAGSCPTEQQPDGPARPNETARIGAKIGHEKGYGFYDQGSKSDADGVLRNWWTDASRENFEPLTARLVEQTNAFEPIEGMNINGELTLGENIGDLGGLAIV